MPETTEVPASAVPLNPQPAANTSAVPPRYQANADSLPHEARLASEGKSSGSRYGKYWMVVTLTRSASCTSASPMRMG
jgi:hypothetical protein